MPLGEEHSSTLVVEVDGSPLPADVHGHHGRRVRRRQPQRARHVRAALHRHGRDVLTKGGFTIGAKVRLLVQTRRPGGPQPLLNGEVTALETGAVRRTACTPSCAGSTSRTGCSGAGGSRPTSSPTASDIARKVAQRAGLRAGRIDAARPGAEARHAGRRQRLGVPAPARDRDRLPGRGGRRQARLPDDRQPPATAPSGSPGSRENPLVLERGVNLVTLRATVTSADQVAEVEVRGWDMSTKAKVVVCRRRRHGQRRSSPTSTPRQLAKKFGSPRYVTPFSTFDQQAQVDAAAKAIAGAPGRRLRGARGRRPRQPQAARRVRRSRSSEWASRSRAGTR